MKYAFWIICWCWGTSLTLAQTKTLGTAKLPNGTEKRAAVIVANQHYIDPRYDLQKTHNDADDMKITLEGMGFTIFPVKKDLKEREFAREINALNEKLKGYQVVFFYYSGHGAEYHGENYLIPIDIELEYNADIETQGIELSKIYEAFTEAGVKTGIVALYACRSLPVGKGTLPNGLMVPADNILNNPVGIRSKVGS